VSRQRADCADTVLSISSDVPVGSSQKTERGSRSRNVSQAYSEGTGWHVETPQGRDDGRSRMPLGEPDLSDDHAGRIFENFYSIGGLEQTAFLVIGVAELALILAFVAGIRSACPMDAC